MGVILATTMQAKSRRSRRLTDWSRLVGTQLPGSIRLAKLIHCSAERALFEARPEPTQRNAAATPPASAGANLVRLSLASEQVEVATLQPAVKSAADLEIPYALRPLEIQRYQSWLCCAMPYAAGACLDEVLSEHGPLSPEQAVSLGSKVLRALVFAHEHGLLHRDLCPANLLISEVSSCDVSVQVLGFGLADCASPSVDVGWCAPEQFAGGTPSAATDLFSLSMILYWSLTGRRPFRGASPVDRLAEVEHGPPPLLSPRGLVVPPGLVALIREGLAEQVSARPCSAAAFLDRLGQSVQRESPASLPAGGRQRRWTTGAQRVAWVSHLPGLDIASPPGVQGRSRRLSRFRWSLLWAILMGTVLTLGVVYWRELGIGARLLRRGRSSGKAVTSVGESGKEPLTKRPPAAPARRLPVSLPRDRRADLVQRSPALRSAASLPADAPELTPEPKPKELSPRRSQVRRRRTRRQRQATEQRRFSPPQEVPQSVVPGPTRPAPAASGEQMEPNPYLR